MPGDEVVGAGDTSKDIVNMSLRKRAPIPVVDLSLPEAEVVEELRKACIYPGFFHLIGLPDGTLTTAEKALQSSKGFFSLPESSKTKIQNCPDLQLHVTDVDGQRYPVPGTGNGYRAPGKDHHFDLDARESFNVGREPMEPSESNAPVYKNAWPDESQVPGFRDDVLAHQRNMISLANRLRRLIALALGAPEDFFEVPGLFDKPTLQTGFVRYLPEKSRPQDEKPRFGIKPHADGGLVTLLYTDGSPGLHICPDKQPSPQNRIWTPVEHRKDALVVNLGTDLERWSNGKFPATLHCVVSETGKERYSMPFFYETNIDAEVVPFCAPGEAKYEVSSPQSRFLTGQIGRAHV